jgi:diguanylate cyclase (GGDEF)-like protein
MIDIDRFKRVNDACGHLAGDRALARVAKVLCRHLRSEDVAARYGGEEFVVLLPTTGPEGAVVVAERLRRAVARERQRLPGGRMLSLTISVGVAVFPDDGLNAAALLKRADEALYAAKRLGRNRVVRSLPPLSIDLPAAPALPIMTHVGTISPPRPSS